MRFWIPRLLLAALLGGCLDADYLFNTSALDEWPEHQKAFEESAATAGIATDRQLGSDSVHVRKDSDLRARTECKSDLGGSRTCTIILPNPDGLPEMCFEYGNERYIYVISGHEFESHVLQKGHSKRVTSIRYPGIHCFPDDFALPP